MTARPGKQGQDGQGHVVRAVEVHGQVVLEGGPLVQVLVGPVTGVVDH